MANRKSDKAEVSRRAFLRAGAAGLAGGLLRRSGSEAAAATRSGRGSRDVSHIYHARNGMPGQNVARVFDMAYGGIENFIGPQRCGDLAAEPAVALQRLHPTPTPARP